MEVGCFIVSAHRPRFHTHAEIHASCIISKHLSTPCWLGVHGLRRESDGVPFIAADKEASASVAQDKASPPKAGSGGAKASPASAKVTPPLKKQAKAAYVAWEEDKYVLKVRTDYPSLL